MGMGGRVRKVEARERARERVGGGTVERDTVADRVVGLSAIGIGIGIGRVIVMIATAGTIATVTSIVMIAAGQGASVTVPRVSTVVATGVSAAAADRIARKSQPSTTRSLAV